MTALAHALDYAEHGLPVLPIKPGEKRPPMSGWQNHATTDAATIENWFTGLYADHGVGIATGGAIFALDIDVSDGKAGDETLADLELRYGALPDTATVLTGSGGQHRYFRAPAGVIIRNDAGRRLGPGLDIRGEGGQCVAPPTIHPNGNAYEWDGGDVGEIVEAPAWLIELLIQQPKVEPVAPASAGEQSDSVAARYNAQTTWAQLLAGDGWTLAQTMPDGEQRWVRPGKDAREGISATVGHGGGDQLTVFSSSINWLPEGSYSRFGYYACRHHGGDRSAAASQLYAADMAPVNALLESVPVAEITHDDMPSVSLDEPPLPLGTTHRHGPPFPLEVLPDWIADQCREIAYAFQVPEDLPAMLALGSLSTILAGHVKVNLTGSAWTEHVNLYLVSALLPGSGKSPVFKVMTKPVLAVENESRATAKKALNEYEMARRLNEQRIKNNETIAVKGTKEEQRTAEDAIGDLLDTLDAQVRPSAGYLVSEDITPEALVEELAANGGRMALLSSEGGIFDMMAGQYVDKGKATNLAVYLQGWSADSVRRKRTKGEAIVIDEALLTVCVTTQPGVVEALGANRELVTKGVPVRFMFSVPPSLVGYRDRRRVLEDIDSTINATYQDTMAQIGLAALDDPDLRMLQLTSAAGDRFISWDQAIEDQQRPGGALEARAEWAAKLRATVLRCCGILHIADRSKADRVEVDVVERAIRLADYWLAHADVVEKMWSDDQVTARARAIVRWSLDNNKPEFSLRDVTSKRGTFPTAEDAVSPLQALVDSRWVIPLQGGPVEVMGRGTPSQRFRLREDAQQWLDSSAQPAQLPEMGQVARIARVVHENEVQIHHPLPHNLQASENTKPHAQPAQPAQLAATGTDDFTQTTDDDDDPEGIGNMF